MKEINIKFSIETGNTGSNNSIDIHYDSEETYNKVTNIIDEAFDKLNKLKAEVENKLKPKYRWVQITYDPSLGLSVISNDDPIVKKIKIEATDDNYKMLSENPLIIDWEFLDDYDPNFNNVLDNLNGYLKTIGETSVKMAINKVSDKISNISKNLDKTFQSNQLDKEVDFKNMKDIISLTNSFFKSYKEDPKYFSNFIPKYGINQKIINDVLDRFKNNKSSYSNDISCTSELIHDILNAMSNGETSMNWINRIEDVIKNNDEINSVNEFLVKMYKKK